jgi:hypothetical protein
MNATADPMVFALESLEQTLVDSTTTEKPDWLARLDCSLADVKQVARQRNAVLNAGNGELVNVDSPLVPSPRRDRLSDRLHDELDGILEQVASVRAEVRSEVALSFTAKFGPIRNRVVRLLDSLKRYEKDETGAVQEAVNTDLGGES